VRAKRTVYLDYAATSPPDEDVVAAMQPYLTAIYGNPSSVHGPGRRARHAVEESREKIAAVLEVSASEIVFTAGGTESDNMALRSVLAPGAPRSVVVSGTEHEAVRSTARALASKGVTVSWISPDEHGGVSAEAVEEALPGEPALVSVMHVNNETGVVNPVSDVARLLRDTGGILHTDAVQSAAAYPLRNLVAEVDLLSLSGHKIGGPKGIGMLFVRSGVTTGQFMHGGSQERGRRGGTENVAGIVGFSEALSRAQARVIDEAPILRSNRDFLARELQRRLGDRVRITTPGEAARACPHILHVVFVDDNGRGLDNEMLILGLDMEGVYVSSGAACSSGAVEPSHVLTEIGMPADLARGAVRFSLGHGTTRDDVVLSTERIEAVVNRVALRN
jgi:cysteine desulfurase